MESILLAIVLVGGCLLMHFLMMRKSGHANGHQNVSDQHKSHTNHHCCH